ncbi:DUF2000 domain-containing protein [Candidatus Woesearchaeota archaeon]|nr:DUF2000 domain-containing protein [Candidatus Woesearchaeota archaeon]
MIPDNKKLVAVLNEKIEVGKVMNALAHMSLGFGGMVGQEVLFLKNYKDADNGDHAYISGRPYIILQARNSNQLRTLRQAALQHKIQFVDFTSTMTEGTYEDQIKRSSETKEADLDYWGIVLFGEKELVSELTKKFSLWK